MVAEYYRIPRWYLGIIRITILVQLTVDQINGLPSVAHHRPMHRTLPWFTTSGGCLCVGGRRAARAAALTVQSYSLRLCCGA
jgi:hypothetical protein